MSADRARLLALAEAVADRRTLNWAEAESASLTEEDRELVRQLHLLAELAEAHDSIDDVPHAAADRHTEPLDCAPTWGPLEIRERVGAGNFGAVYRVWDPRLARDVALKLLHVSKIQHAQAPAVIEEGRLLARVRHPHVITVYGADRFDERVGICMEFIEGRTLEALLADHGPLSGREAAAIGIELSSALAAVHRAGLVHRDVKMQNVMREHGGRIVLMDFGAGHDIAAADARGMAGTPCYMAPELFTRQPATPQSDIFSLGVLLFRAVSGEYPVVGRTTAEVKEAHERRRYRRLVDVRPDLPPGFIAVVERALAPAPADRFQTAGEMNAALVHAVEPAAPSPAIDPVVLRPSSGRGRVVAAALALLVLASLALLNRARLTALLVPQTVHNIVVLPLENLSGDAADGYFADGVTEILSSRLAGVSAFRVIARSSIASLPGNERDPASLRRRFGADYAVEGAVQRKGERVLITARLVEASSGMLRWGSTYDRPLQDLFSLQGEVAVAIASATGARLSGDTSRRLQARETTSTEAQDAYLQGRHLLYTFNRARLAEARAFFEQATAIDPDYAIAHASLSRTLAMMIDLDVASAGTLQPLATASALRAVELNPGLPETNVALADVKYRFQHDWQGADAAYQRALDLAPHAAIVLTPYSRFLCAAGRMDEALRLAEDGEQADPLSAEMVASVGIAHYYRRDFDAALRSYQRAAAIAPTFGPVVFGMARAYSAKGDYRNALDYIRKAEALVGTNATYQAELARNYALGGWRDQAEQVLGGLLLNAKVPGSPVSYEGIGYAYSALGDKDRAFEWLDRAFDHYHARMLFVNVDPRADPLRDDPRFAVLVRRLGLTP